MMSEHCVSIPCEVHVSLLMQGRLIDHVHNTQSVGLEDLQALVLDEADRLLEMGFMEEVSSPPFLLCLTQMPCLNTVAVYVSLSPLMTASWRWAPWEVTSSSCSALLFLVP